MPANGRWDLIRRLKVKDSCNKTANDDSRNYTKLFIIPIKPKQFSLLRKVQGPIQPPFQWVWGFFPKEKW